VNGSLSDAALLLIGHGSTTNADSAAPTYQHAAELRRRRIFRDVREAFWKQEPFIQPVLAQIEALRVFAVPVFLSEGYFTQQMIPAELGIAKATEAGTQLRPGQFLFYCEPIGTHPSVTGIILARAEEIVRMHPFPRAPKPEETVLFLAAHGTERNEESRRTVERHVETIRNSTCYAGVYAVFMEESPRVGECYEMTSTKHIVVVPFLISDGLHAREDIPRLLGEPERIVQERLQKGQATWRNPTERKGKRVWYARSVGTEPHLADVILERVNEAAQRNSRPP
jgi:sirohydrochlorin cobaltochelatase